MSNEPDLPPPMSTERVTLQDEESFANPSGIPFTYATPSDLAPPSSRRIRLLSLLPSANLRAPVRCVLGTYALSSAPAYEALSYVWGLPASWPPSTPLPHTIYIGDSRDASTTPSHTIGVTTNLRAALRRLRPLSTSSAPRHLWVDALCINQGDLTELGGQVGLMRDIYRAATRVLVWLDADSKPPFSTHEWKAGLDGDGRDDDKALFSELSYMAQKPWFARTWTVQEFGVATDVLLVCGRWQCPWTRCARSWQMRRLEDEARLRDREKGAAVALNGVMLGLHSVLGPYIDSLGALYALRQWSLGEADVRAAPAERLLDVLVQCRARGATKAVDKVYGLLGLVKGVESLGIEIDYRRAEADVFTHTATRLLLAAPNLDALGAAAHHEVEPGETSMPSWVPDWSKQQLTAKLLRHGRDFDVRATEESGAAAGGAPEVYVSSDNVFLGLQGYEIGVLDALADELRAGFNLKDLEKAYSQFDLKSENATWRDMIAKAGETIEMLLPVAAPLETLMQWERLAGVTDKLGRRQPEADATYMDTLCAGVYFNGNRRDTVEAYDRWMASMKGLRRMKAVGVGSLPSVFKPAAIWSQLRASDTKGVFVDLLTHAWHRRLATSLNGGLALVPARARQGDSVVLVKGGRWPLVMRRHDESWLLVGEAYVREAMYGSLWDEGRCEPMLVK